MSSPSGAVGALVAVSRLLALSADGSPEDVRAAIVAEAVSVFAAGGVALLGQAPGRRVTILAGGTAGLDAALDEHPAVAELLDRGLRVSRLDAARSRDLAALAPGRRPPGSAVLLRLRSADAPDGVLVLTDPPPGIDGDVATAFADAAAAALDRLHLVAEHERVTARQQALTRAAKTLNGTLELDTVLTRICHEAAALLGATSAVVLRGCAETGLTVAAATGLPPESIGHRIPAGVGLAGKVVLSERAMLTNELDRIANTPADLAYDDRYRSALAAPMSWDGELRGVLSVGWAEDAGLTHEDLALLETFAELAATACANASAHAGLALAARTDGLTGCLNHAALHEGIRREIERAMRTDGAPLSLVLVDLDDFKAVNEANGHLAGDEVLRRAGHALRHATRPYDLAARYGGDEFALLAVEADEEAAAEVAARALERIGAAIGDLLPDGASPGTAGVAEWGPGVTATELVARADRALLFAKQEGFRGGVHAFSAVPDRFRPARFARHERHMPEPPPMPRAPAARSWPDERRLDERLRRRTRQLALANALGARVAAMTDVDDIVEAAVEELHRAFGFFCAAVVRIRPDDRVDAAALRGALFLRLQDRHWSQPRETGLIGRCLRTRRPVLSGDVRSEPDYTPTDETSEVRSELVVPLFVGEELWGAINVEEITPGAFDADDQTLLETVAAQIGSAMRSASLYERLERAYLGTAEALAAALEAKDRYTADHARSVVEQAEAVGRVLGLGEDELRDVRFAAVFHDIGKIAIPERILHKPGPLDADERREMERHPVVGEQILAPAEFLTDVRRMVRHEHERFDGGGYPDGLAGAAIPLGSRIILACDAFHAMTSDRPYRSAMSTAAAREELRRHAGTQFDPAVVEALLALL